MSIFLDTSFLFALYRIEDENNEKAVELAKLIVNKEFGSAFISGYIFDEVITLCRAKSRDASKAIAIGNAILNSETEILQVTKDAFDSSWEIFKQKKNLSFTDCTTISLMKKNGVRHLAAFDCDFKQFKNEIKILPA